MIDAETQRALAGIRADIADIEGRLNELKERATGISNRPFHWMLETAVAMLDLARENLAPFEVDAVIALLLDMVELPHPLSILRKMRLSDEDITAAVRERMKRARGRNRERLAELLQKLEYSAELRKGARQRQRKSRRRRQRKGAP